MGNRYVQHPVSIVTALFLWAVIACDRYEPEPIGKVESYVRLRSIEIDTVDVVRDVFRDSAGRIWVLAATSPFLTVFDSTGAVLRSGGRRGRGPSDFLFPFLFAGEEASREAPTVVDLGRHQVVGVDSYLSAAQSYGLRLISGVMRSDMPKIVAHLPFAVSGSAGNYVAVVITRNVSNETDLAFQSVIHVHDGIADTVWRHVGTTAAELRWLRPFPMWSSCGNEGLIGVSASGRTAYRISARGEVDSSRVPIRVARRPIGEQELRLHARYRVEQEYFESGLQPTENQLSSDVDVAVKRVRLSNADSLPLYSSIKCGSGKEYWLQKFDLNDDARGASRQWYRVGGNSATPIQFPHRFRPFSFSQDAVLGVETDSNDVSKVVYLSRRR